MNDVVYKMLESMNGKEYADLFVDLRDNGPSMNEEERTEKTKRFRELMEQKKDE